MDEGPREQVVDLHDVGSDQPDRDGDRGQDHHRGKDGRAQPLADEGGGEDGQHDIGQRRPEEPADAAAFEAAGPVVPHRDRGDGDERTQDRCDGQHRDHGIADRG